MTDQEQFENIYTSKITRDGASAFLDILRQTDFFTAPSSARHGCSYAGGLVHHSLDVYNILTKRLEGNTAYTEETIAIVALLHDVCKINRFELRSNGAYYVNDRLPLGVYGDKSICIIQQAMLLSIDEIMAIRAHVGGWDYSVRAGDPLIGNIFSKCPLAVHLHIADLEAAYLTDK